MFKETKFYTFVDNGTRWTVSKGCGQLLEDRVLRRLGESLSSERCKVVKENLYRTVYRHRPFRGNSPGIYVKRYVIKDWANKVLARFNSSQAHREWRTMLEMEKRGFSVPEPLAFGQRWQETQVENYLITLEVMSAVPFSQATDMEKERLLKALAFLAARLQRNNIYYKDFQLGNLLVQRKGPEPRLILVDLHSARWPIILSREQRFYMLAKLIDSFEPTFSLEDRDIFLKLYAQEDPFFKEEVSARTVKSLASQIRQTHLKSRTVRCLVDSTSFAVEEERGWRLYFRREYTKEEVFEALKAEERASGVGGAVLKSAQKSDITLVETSKGKVCVKRYKNFGALDYVKGWLGHSRAKRAWVIGNGLVVRGIPTSAPMALVEGSRESFLITKALADYPRIDYYILERFKNPLDREGFLLKKKFINSFAQAIRSLHEKKTYHGDLKACNILVKEVSHGGWEYYYIDYDRVIFDKEVSFRRCVKNMAQLHTSIPWCITWADRMRFFKSYAQGTGLMSRKREFIRDVLRESAKRIPVVMEPLE
ncbi:MAG TPA: lipopolysaccharide kinase InaA family protein [Candidatus Hypogeohydataceae bacterium YC38]